MQKNILFLFLLYLTSLSGNQFEQDFPLSMTDSGYSTLVGGCVNILTGEFVDCEEDIVIPSIEPLVFSRSYCSGDLRWGGFSHAWHDNHCSYMLNRFVKTDLRMVYRSYFVEGSGATSIYDAQNLTLLPDLQKDINLCISKSPEVNKGFTNIGRGLISGQTNLKNTLMSATKKDVEVKMGSGEVRHYHYDRQRGKEANANFYFLESVRLPSGNKLEYTYKDGFLSEIKAKNGKGDVTFGSFKFKRKVNGLQLEGLSIQTSDDRKVEYEYYTRYIAKFQKQDILHQFRYYLTKCTAPNHPEVKFNYHFTSNEVDGKIDIKIFPDKKYFFIEWECDPKNQRAQKVKAIHAQAGDTDRLYPIYRFEDKNVYDALNHKTLYEHNGERIFEITRFSGTNPSEYSPYSQETFTWGKGSEEGYLKRKDFKSKGHKYTHSIRYEYDEFGNVEKDSFYGNLSGKCPERTEHYDKSYTYTKDGFNLLTSETEEEQRITYTYKPGTNLLIEKITYVNDQIVRREFRDYDGNAACSFIAIDDGSSNDPQNLEGATERRITVIEPKAIAPCIGLPEWIHEFYYDFSTHSKIPLRSTRNVYSKEGCITATDVYDSQGELIMAQSWEYNHLGQVIKEMNTLGQTAIKEYDDNGNCKYEEGFRKGCNKSYTYDRMNRLTKVSEQTSFNDDLISSFTYDLLGNKETSTDSYGRKTYYFYDEFNRLIEIALPEVEDEKGNFLKPHIKLSYDISGNVISQTDGRGNRTLTDYNAYNKPISIQYADGTKESFFYYLNGTLKEHVDKNGSSTRYTYDPQRRLLTKEIYSREEVLLDKTTNRYNTFHLLETTNFLGHSTFYTYDGAGRKNSEKTGDSLVTYEYDDFDLLIRSKKFFGKGPNDCIVTEWSYDLLGRVEEERHLNPDGGVEKCLRYTYDEAGNIRDHIQENGRDFSITTTLYDSLNRPIEITDPEGKKTVIHYDRHGRDLQGKEILIKTTIDSLGYQVQEIHDALDRVVEIKVFNLNGEIVSRKGMCFDFANNLVEERHDVFTEGQIIREVINTWEYDSQNRIISLTEASGSPEQKTTHIIYNSKGQKETIIKPDQVTLTHHYDELGRLKGIISSDKTIHLAYDYDKNHHVVLAFDHIQNEKTERIYDDNERLQEERLGNGHVIKYSYDCLGRVTAITHPDDLKIDYSYGGLYLRNIQFQKGKDLFCHSYQEYDMNGQVLKEKAPGKGGVLEYSYDPLGRLTSSKGPHHLIDEIVYDKRGNLTSFNKKSPEGKHQSHFTYDDLNQLSVEDGPSKHRYKHDSLFNRLEKDEEAYELNDISQILSSGKKTFSYDDNGNLIEKQEGHHKTAYSYDALNRLTQIETEEFIESYTYDPFSRRLSKTINGKNRDTYFYVGEQEAGAFDEKGIRERRILGLSRSGAEIGATVAIDIRGAPLSFPYHDHNGNIIGLIDCQSGAILETIKYDAFGVEESKESGICPWRFSSKRCDLNSGLVFFGRRYYDPDIGRWITADPKGYAEGPNLFAYVMNNPLTRIDPWGLAWQRYGDTWHRENSSTARRLRGERTSRGPCLFHRSVNHSIGTISRTGHKFLSNTRSVLENVDHYIKNNRIFWGTDGDTTPFYAKVAGNTRHYEAQAAAYVHGMENTIFEGIKDGEVISEYHDGEEMWQSSHPTRGFNIDLTECAWIKLGMMMHSLLKIRILNYDTGAVKATRAMLLEMIDSVGGTDGEGTVRAYGHSKGAILIKAALMTMKYDQQQMVVVRTLGGGAFISSDICRDARNYVSSRDPIPFLASPLGYLSRYFSSNSDLVVVPSITGGFFDHSISNQTYRGVLKNLGEDFLSNKL